MTFDLSSGTINMRGVSNPKRKAKKNQLPFIQLLTAETKKLVPSKET